MARIALDAMGGDHAPRSEVEGAVLAARESEVRVLLVGREEVIRRELEIYDTAGLPLDILPASEVVTMDDHPVKALRN